MIHNSPINPEFGTQSFHVIIPVQIFIYKYTMLFWKVKLNVLYSHTIVIEYSVESCPHDLGHPYVKATTKNLYASLS